MEEVIGVRELYNNLKKRSEVRAPQFSTIDVLVRLREGIKSPHSQTVLSLFWWHIFLTDRPLYYRLKTAVDEPSIRQILGGKVMTTYVQGEKTVAVCSDIFPLEFFEIIDAYLDYIDELCR